MKSNCDILGNYIHLIDVRNSENISDKVLGINIDKYFMPSVANIIGTDLSKYKLISKGCFACNPMHVGRDERLPVALYKDDVPALVSPAYFMFEIIDRNILNEEYLMMWFLRPEFDRNCWLKTDGSVRGGITWEDFCRIEVFVPSIEEQKKIVNNYQIITKRIELKKKINENLEQQAQAIYDILLLNIKSNSVKLSSVIDVKDGTHDSPKSQKTGYPLVTSKHLLPYGADLISPNLISKKDFDKINERSLVEHNDILMSMIGTVGIVSLVIDNTVKYAIKNVALFKTSNSNFIYFILCYLKSKSTQQYIDMCLTGSTQKYISLSELRKMPITLPNDISLHKFNSLVKPIFNQISINAQENQRLSALRNTLLPKLMNGEIDISKTII